MWYKRVNPDGNDDNSLVNVVGGAGCCDESVTEYEYEHAPTINLGTNNITGITGTDIEGGTITFDTAGTTLATLYAGINAAMEASGFVDIGGSAGTVVSGSASAAVVVIKTTGALTKLEGSNSDVTLTAA